VPSGDDWYLNLLWLERGLGRVEIRLLGGLAYPRWRFDDGVAVCVVSQRRDPAGAEGYVVLKRNACLVLHSADESKRELGDCCRREGAQCLVAQLGVEPAGVDQEDVGESKGDLLTVG
jgi:hypothetical protein